MSDAGPVVLYRVARPLLFALPAETVHHWVSNALGVIEAVLERLLASA